MAGLRGFGGRRRVGAVALAMTLACAAPAAAPADTLRLDADNLKQLALLMLDSGRPAEALAMAEALLQRDGTDSVAHAIRSRAERDMGQNEDAVAAGRLAWKTADSPEERFGAAMVMAQGLASGGSKFRAQFWLRRAMQEAPDEALKRAAERDFAYVRSRSRLWLRFDASIQPSSNVNNGSSSSILWFYGFPLTISGDAQALSGAEATVGVTLKYRLSETETHKTDFVFAAVEKLVALSSEAKAQAPTARASDYSYTALELGLEHAWRPAALKGGEATAALTWGYNLYGGDPMSDFLRLEAGMSRPISPRLSFRGKLEAEWQNRLDAQDRSADIWTLGLGLTEVTGRRDRLDLDLVLTDTRSESVEIRHERARLALNWARQAPVMGAKLSLGLWAEARDYPESRYSAEGRQDESLGAALSLTFEEADYMGFVPVLTLNAEDTRSNVDLYDSRTLGIGFSIRSKF